MWGDGDGAYDSLLTVSSASFPSAECQSMCV